METVSPAATVNESTVSELKTVVFRVLTLKFPVVKAVTTPFFSNVKFKVSDTADAVMVAATRKASKVHGTAITLATALEVKGLPPPLRAMNVVEAPPLGLLN